MEGRLVSEFFEEVIDEVSGRSTAKWGIALVAFLVGVAVAVAVVRRRGKGTDLDAQQSAVDQVPA